MRVCENPLLRPLWMRREEAAGDRAGHGIVSPLQKVEACVIRFIRLSQALIDWREKLVSPEVCWINRDDAFKSLAGFGNAA